MLPFRTTGTALCLLAIAAAAPAQQSQDAAAVPQRPSSLVQPALDSVAKAGSGVDLNRWKGSTAVKSDVDGNLLSMQKDIQSTLPPLLSAADAMPGSASASLPLLLNLDALYNVLLRVTIASRSGAPREENTALEQAAVLLDSARRDLGDATLAAAKAQDRRMADLQARLQQNTQLSVAAPAPAPATTVKSKSKRHKATTAAKPAATAARPTTTQ